MIIRRMDVTRMSAVDLIAYGMPTGYTGRLLGGAVTPVVIDTNVILMSLRRFMRDRSSAWLGAAKAGTLKVFAAKHVHDEVLEHLPTIQKQTGHRVADLARTLVVEFWPWIRFVDVSTTTSTLDEDSVADIDDRPTVRLISLLAPAISLSRDPDLLDAGFATPDSVGVFRDGAIRGQLINSAVSANLGLNVTAMAAQAGAGALRRRPLLAVGLMITAFCGLSFLVARRPTGVIAARAAVRQLAFGICEGIAQQVQVAAEAAARLDAATVRRTTDQTHVERLARMLAMEPKARSHVELADELRRQGLAATPETTLATLRSNRAFVHEGRWGWRLGDLAG